MPRLESKRSTNLAARLPPMTPGPFEALAREHLASVS